MNIRNIPNDNDLRCKKRYPTRQSRAFVNAFGCVKNRFICLLGVIRRLLLPASFLHTFINITFSPLLARALPFLDHRSLCRLSREFIKTRPWAFNRRSRQSAHQKTDTACLLDQSPMDLSPHLLGAPLLGTNPVACERLRRWWVHGHERLETALGEIIDASTWARNGR